MKPRVVVIADDLTGAADTGVTFAKQGAEAVVVWDVRTHVAPEVLILTTESRHLSREEAMARVHTVVARIPGLGRDGGPWIYKKIDSTLRGHPGPELAALLGSLGNVRALVTPAFPAQGRSVRAGVHTVHGVPLTETPFGSEVSSSDVLHLMASGFPEAVMRSLRLPHIRKGVAAVARELQNAEVQIWIADAETEADLRTLARAAAVTGTLRVLCGSAGLAQALAEILAGTFGPQTMLTPAAPSGRDADTGVLVIAASRHPQTLAQIAAAEAAGISILRPSPEWFADDADTEVEVRSLATALRSGAAVLTTAGLPTLPGRERVLCARLARTVVALLGQVRPAGLVLTGGDAAIAVSQALQAEALRLQGEVAPGMPWGTLLGGLAPGLPVVTKAGGFGDKEALLAAIRFLQDPSFIRASDPGI